MVLPEELIRAIKRRAAERRQSVTAYVSELVRHDLGQPLETDHGRMAEQIRELQDRVDQLEQGGRGAG